MEEEILAIQDVMGQGQSKLIYSQQKGTEYDVFIYDIGALQEYESLILTLRQASERDTIRLNFDSSGGDLTTALAICNEIKRTKAKVIGVIVGSCMSAATFMWLVCNERIINENTTFMIHAASNGYRATIHEMNNFTSFSQKMYERVFNEYYLGFLSREELDSVFNGATLWFMPEDVRKRLIQGYDYSDIETSASLVAEEQK